MTGKTHIAGGVAACAVIQQLAGLPGVEAATLMINGAAGALIPDICHAGSKIGRRFPLLAGVVRLLFGHRTVTHSLLFVIVVGAALFSFIPNYSTVRDGLLIGMISHLVLDAATVKGIELFWPFRQKVRLPLYTRTGGLVETILFILFIVTIFWYGVAVQFPHPFHEIFPFRFANVFHIGYIEHLSIANDGHRVDELFQFLDFVC